MLAIVEAYRAGLLQPKHWWTNILAGLVVTVIAIPFSMAFAIASGATPAQGLYTAIIAGFIVSVLGGSRVQISGPTGAFVVILAGITAKYGYDGLQIATLIAGIMLLLMGFARLGNVIKFIPDSVIVGFTTGIGVLIFVGQWKDFFGLQIKMPLDTPFYQKTIGLVQAFPTISLTTTALSALSVFLILVTPKITRRIPGPLMALIIVTLLQAVFQFEGVATLGSAFGGIPQTLPEFHIPHISIEKFLELLGPAFTIALLGAIESLLCAQVADGMIGTRHHSNQELLGQGVANMLCPLFGGFASTGAITRTATSIRHGGTSPIAGITMAVALVLVLLVLAPWASYIPLSVLSSILFVMAINMGNIPYFIHNIKSAPRSDVMVLVATFLFTVLTDLVMAVNVGVILSMLFFIRKMSRSVKIEEQAEQHLASELATKGFAMPKDTLIYAINGPFFFGAAKNIEHALGTIHNDPKVIVFRLKEVPFIDLTGLETFKNLMEQFHKRGVKIYLCEATPTVQEKLESMHLFKHVVGKRTFKSLHAVLKDMKGK